MCVSAAASSWWLLEAAGGVDFVPLLVCAGMFAAAVGISRSSLLVQIVSRGVAWLVLGVSSIALAFMAQSGFHGTHAYFLGALTLVIALGAGASLVLAHPALASNEARAQFAPVGYRRWFLASSTASAAAAAMTGLLAVDSHRVDDIAAAGAM